MNNKTFCPLPWTGLSINPQQGYSPCRQFATDKPTSLNEYESSEVLNKVKSQLLAGEKPTECSFCYELEDGGFRSLREHAQLAFPSVDTSKQDYKYVIYQVNGNLCNLACRTCDSRWSSAWSVDERRAAEIIPIHYAKHKRFYTDPEFIVQMEEICTNAKDITFAGGEPFMSVGQDIHLALIKKLPVDTKLTYITNGTLLPPADLIKEWNRFTTPVSVRLSIDAVESQFEYIRFPAKWEVVDSNAAAYLQTPNVDLNIECTVSIFNILSLPNILRWCVKHNITKPFITFTIDAVIGTVLLDCRGLPADVKEEISKKLDHPYFSDVIRFMNSIQLEVDEEARRKYIKAYDILRNQSLTVDFPELAKLLKYE